MNEIHLKDCLCNLDMNENNNISATSEQKKYYEGIVIGVFATLLACGYGVGDASILIKRNLPLNFVQDVVKF